MINDLECFCSFCSFCCERTNTNRQLPLQHRHIREENALVAEVHSSEQESLADFARVQICGGKKCFNTHWFFDSSFGKEKERKRGCPQRSLGGAGCGHQGLQTMTYRTTADHRSAHSKSNRIATTSRRTQTRQNPSDSQPLECVESNGQNRKTRKTCLSIEHSADGSYTIVVGPTFWRRFTAICMIGTTAVTILRLYAH
jgi:hypothetical protein